MHQGVYIPSLWLPSHGQECVASYLRRTRTVAAGGITDPTDIDDLELWLAADNLVGLSDADPVATWNDESGNNRDATQATSGSRPTYKTGILNSLPVVRFDGTDDHFSLPDFMSGFTAGEVFLLVKTDADPPAEAQTGLWAVNNSLSTHFTWTDSTIYDAWGTNARKSTGNPTLSLSDEFRIYNVISASGEWTSNIDGSQHFTTSSNTVFFGNLTPLLGKSFGSYFLDGDIAEYAQFSRKLTAQERSDMEDYLNTKYALGL